MQSGQTTTAISTALQAGPKMAMASTLVQAGTKTTLTGSATAPSLGALKRNTPKAHLTSNSQSSKSDAIPINVPKTGPRVEPVGVSSAANSPKKLQTTNIQKSSKLDVSPVIVPRTRPLIEPTFDSRKVSGQGRVVQSSTKTKFSNFRKQITSSYDSESESTPFPIVYKGFKSVDLNEMELKDFPSDRKQSPNMLMEQPLTYQYQHCMFYTCMCFP